VKRRWSILWAARFIARWEGFLGYAYWDSLGGVWTIGYGHTPAQPGERWSRAKALRVLGGDCRSAAHAVDKLVKHRLTVRQRIALISFIFNLGPGVLPHSDLLKALNRGEFHRAARELLDYDHAGGQRVLGLTRRRRSEAWLLTHPRKRPPERPTPTHHKAHRRAR